MTTYNTYQEAKTANPECEIIQSRNLDNLFRALGSGVYTGWNICNPADHCMTVDRFLADGHKFVEGDIYLDVVGNVSYCDDEFPPFILNEANHRDSERYILHASALEDKKPRTKVEYVKVSAPCDFFELKSEFRGEELSFINEGGDYEVATTLVELVTGFDNMNLYRRIETPMTEREAFVDECKKFGGLRARDGADEVYGNLFDSGKFKLVN